MKREQIYTSYMYSYPHKTAYRPIDISRFEIEERLFCDAFGLYLHIPFCETKCGYCNLFSVTGKDEDYFDRYLTAMSDQAEQLGLDKQPVSWQSLTIGGGTPLLLSVRQLESVLDLADRIGALNTYSCIETSPNQTTAAKAELLKAKQMNRVSIGVQSFIAEELKTLGRYHSPQAAGTALGILKDSGFECLNLDLIYGIPGQTAETVRYSLDQAMAYEPDELFVYPLYIRKGTGLYRRARVQHEDTYAFYHLIRDYLQERGYHQLSMRRFVRVRTGSTCGCGLESTLSLGCGGRSYIGSLHSCTPYAVRPADCLKLLEEYIAQPDQRRMNFGYRLDEEEQKRRYVIKNLLHVSGIDESEYEILFSLPAGSLGRDFPVLAQLRAAGYCSHQNRSYRLTPLGMSLSDYIGPLFISPAVAERMVQWRMGG